MSIVPFQGRGLIQRLFTSQTSQGLVQGTSVNLTRMGTLYIAASICQVSWLYLVVSNYEVAKLWVGLPVIGWVFLILWFVMIWCVPHLFFLGLRMILTSRNPMAVISQTDRQRKRQMNIALLLVLGILLDVILFPLMLGLEDKSLAVFMTGLMGGRVAQVNLEAIFQYHNM